MRALSMQLAAAQTSFNRNPESEIIIRDVMLRLNDLSTGAYDTGYPNASDDSSIPQCPMDAALLDHGNILRTWTTDTNLHMQSIHTPDNQTSWISGGITVDTGGVDGCHRPSIANSHVFFCKDGTIRKWTTSNGDPDTASDFHASVYTVTTNKVALAAVSDTVVYMLTLHTNVQFKYLLLQRVTATSIEDCPHTIIAEDDDYNSSSLSWFDAETLGNRDVIVLNERTYGHPVVIFYEDGVWSQPRPILPLDIVDNYSFLRIAGLSRIADARGENVLWATGRLGRKGSTGLHPQEYDVVLRTKDGEHWSKDCYSYACQGNMRTKIIPHSGYAYYAGGAIVKQARQTWSMGKMGGDRQWTVNEDILDWSYKQPAAGTTCIGQTSLAEYKGVARVADEFFWDQNWQPDQSEDDCTSGIMGFILDGTELAFGVSDTGIRFKDVTIPQDAIILSAYIKFWAAADDAPGGCHVIIKGEAIDSAATFSTASNFNARARTVKKVAWNNISAWTNGASYKTPDITEIIQEITDRDSWASGNEIVLFLEGTGTANRRAQSWDHAGEDMPTLHVFYFPSTQSFYEEVLAPGYWLWRYAGYNECSALLSTEGIDKLSPSGKVGNRQLSLASRDITTRLLIDWASDQDWQWLSQQKHHDDCDKMDYLYAIGSAQITVADKEDVNWISTVDTPDLEDDVVEAGLLFADYNKPGIFLTTKPFDARNFLVRGRFKFSVPSGTVSIYELGNSITLGTNQGLLSYVTNGFQDTGQDFTDWQTPTKGPAKYTIAIQNTDGTESWGYLGLVATLGTDIYVYEDDELNNLGWNGISPAGRTPESYEVQSRPDRQRLGYGFGVVGLVKDQYNLVTAFYSLCDKVLYLFRRKGDETNGWRWSVLAQSSVTATPDTRYIYDVELSRNGRRFEARVVEWGRASEAATDRNRNFATIVYDWDRADEMAPDTNDDRTKVGIIVNISVPETRVGHVERGAVYITRDLGNWPKQSDGKYDATPTGASDLQGYSVSDAYEDFASSAPLVVGDEEMSMQTRTLSDWRSQYMYIEEKLATRRVKASTIAACEEGKTWADSDNGFGWIFKSLDGDGTGVAALVQTVETSGDRHVFTIDVNDEDWERLTSIQDSPDRFTYFMLLPGASVTRTEGERKTHAAVTLTRLIDEPRIRIRDVWACDEEYDKSLEWVLEDISSKAGILDFDTRLSIDETVAAMPDAGDTAHWLSNVYQRDFDVTVVLPLTPESGDVFSFIARASTKLTDEPVDGNLTSFSAVRVTWGRTGPSLWRAALYQTNATTSDWILVDEVEFTKAVNGKRLRFIGHEEYFTLYINDRWIKTFCIGPIYVSLSDGYESALLDPGYIGVWRSGIGADWNGIVVRQPELWNWTDGIILDQRMNGLAGLRRAIRDRRVKFFGRADGTLKFSLFDVRDEPLDAALDSKRGTLSYVDTAAFQDTVQDFTDWETESGTARYKITVINTDATESWAYLGLVGVSDDIINVYKNKALSTSGWNGDGSVSKTPTLYTIKQVAVGHQIYQDTANRTDRIPTHVRVSGAEISEYIDHAAAAEYGLHFVLAQCPSLEEEEAYQEARCIVRDALERTHGRTHAIVAQLSWEVEDEIPVSFIPADDGPTVDGTYIVDSVGSAFRPGDLTMMAKLRKKAD